MANMSYVRFENTLSDLRDCHEHMDDTDLSDEEERARRSLMVLCLKMAEDYFFKPGESVKQPAEESNEVNGATLKDIAASLHNPFPANGRCPRCGVEMVVGMALESTVTGSPDFIGGEVVTLSPGGPGKLVACMKCIGCGYSTT